MSDDIFDDYIGTNPNGKYPCEEGEIGRCGCPKHKGGPISAPSDWAMEEARKVFYSVNLSGLKYQSAATDLVRNIALALDAARKVPEGCVRLPDGREPTFQWGKSEPGYSADFTERTGEWRSIQAWFSNADIAAEAARKDGTG